MRLIYFIATVLMISGCKLFEKHPKPGDWYEFKANRCRYQIIECGKGSELKEKYDKIARDLSYEESDRLIEDTLYEYHYRYYLDDKEISEERYNYTADSLYYDPSGDVYTSRDEWIQAFDGRGRSEAVDKKKVRYADRQIVTTWVKGHGRIVNYEVSYRYEDSEKECVVWKIDNNYFILSFDGLEQNFILIE